MKIKTQFLITMILFAAVLAIIAASAMITKERVEIVNRQDVVAHDVEREASDLSYLSSDFIFYRERAQAARWESKFSALSDCVAELNPDSPTETAIVAKMKASLQRLKAVFDDVKSATGGETPAGGALNEYSVIQISWSRLAVQTQGLSFDAQSLSQLLRREQDSLRRQNLILIFTLLVLFGAYFVATYLMVSRRIFKSIAQLRAGTRIIGSGNLDFSLETKRNDEIGELSRAFNAMAVNLKSVTASKAELEREMAERWKAEERFRTTLYSIGDAVITTDTESRVRHMNPVAESLTGWKEAEALGRPLEEVFQIINEESGAEVESPALRVLREGKIVGLANHTLLISRDGTAWPIADSGAPIRDVDGAVTGVVLVFRDQTAEREAQAALHANEERFRVLADNISQFACMADEEGRFFWFNKRWYDYTGARESSGTPDWLEFHHPDHVERVTREGKSRFEKGEAWEDIFPLRGKDGNYRWFLFRAVPIRDEGGRVLRWFGTHTDVTEMRQLEGSLRQAKETAEKTSQAKSRFLANMSHEIRTPMNGIMGMTELAMMKTKEPRVKEFLGYVKQSAMHLLDIINDILDLARIEAGKVELGREQFSLRDLLASVNEPFRSGFAEKGVGLESEIDPAIPERLVGDPGRIRQVLTNLIGNALKFTETGHVLTSVGLAGAGEAENRLILQFDVRDTGIGIPPDHLGNIFKSFEQVHTSLHTKYGGAGLGLTICKELAELMGGEIRVESREGVGSTFSFTAVLETAPMEEMERVKPNRSGRAGGPLKILVAEDSRVNQIFIETLLKKEGHSVTVVETGRQALVKLAECGFDVVLMDIRMPDMSGDEAVRVIRQNPPPGVNSKIPVIALTAYALQTERERFMECGFDAYLTKPVEIEKLQALLGDLRFAING